MKNWWKYSKLRFYFLNSFWNYKFWLNAKKIYEIVPQINTVNRFGEKEIKSSKKRFKGYLYKGNIYLDNPGLQGIDRDVWEIWKKKGLIN
jgi:hypothetical protein